VTGVAEIRYGTAGAARGEAAAGDAAGRRRWCAIGVPTQPSMSRSDRTFTRLAKTTVIEHAISQLTASATASASHC